MSTQREEDLRTIALQFSWWKRANELLSNGIDTDIQMVMIYLQKMQENLTRYKQAEERVSKELHDHRPSA